MVRFREEEFPPLISKEPRIGFFGKVADGRLKKYFVSSLLIIAFTLLAFNSRSEDRRTVLEDEEEDEEYFGNSVGLYATHCCSPKDTSCCQATSSAPWIPGVAVVDISPTCKSFAQSNTLRRF